MIKLVMLKNKYPEDWDDKCDCDFAAYSRGGKYLRTNIERYEGCVKFLVPEADDWTEEQWADEALILQCIKTRYGTDYSDDLESLNMLFEAIVDRKNINTYTYHLYCVANFSMLLAQHFWGVEYEKMIQTSFLDIYRRYKRARKNTKYSRYCQTRVMNHWLYKQIGEWSASAPDVLSKRVKTAYFNVSLGV